jgi:metallopeptidase family M12-like protein/all-beta uncharacterized protein
MQYPGECSSNFSQPLASPIFYAFFLFATITISVLFARPIEAERPASTANQVKTSNQVATPHQVATSNQVATPHQVATRSHQTIADTGVSNTSVKLVGSRLQQRDDPEIAKALKKFDLVRLGTAELKSQMQKNGRLLLKTSAGDFDLELTPHDLRSPDYQSQMMEADGLAQRLPITPIRTYKGPVNGSSRAQARMTLTEMGLEGIVITESDRYFLQPARSFSKTAHEDEFVFYNGNDTTESSVTCGVTLADEVAAREQLTNGNGETLQAEAFTPAALDPLSPMRIVRLATDADAEYVAALGGAAQANDHILSIMNQVDGIYQVELGLTFQVVFQNAWSDAATDPYVSTDSNQIITEFVEYWNAHFAGTQRDLSHLWSGKHLVPNAGRSQMGTVCRAPSQSYAVSQRLPEEPANPITVMTIALTAHEIGHNFGAVHPNEPVEVPPDIGPTCQSSIMLGMDGLTFCQFSRSQILSYLAEWDSCLAESSTVPPSYPPCVQLPLDSSLSANGELTTTDCRSPSRGIPFFADQYTFAGQAGERLHINMNPVTPGFEPELYLIAPDGWAVGQVTNLNNPARLPFSGSFTLPQTGKYTIEVTSVTTSQAFGNYTISVTFDGCVLSVSPTSQHFPAGGGSGTINVTATGSGCTSSYLLAKFPFGTPWVMVQTNSGTGSQSLNFTVQANTNTAGRRAFLIVGTVFGDGLSIPITQSGTGPDCSLTPIGFGQTINGEMATTDCVSPIKGVFADRYVFTATAGQEVSLSALASNKSVSLTLLGPDQRIILTDNGGLSLGLARIPGGTGMLTLSLTGAYVVEVSVSGLGPYSLTLATNTPQTPVLLTEENTDVVAAVTSVTALRAPFSLTDPFNFSSDGRTRVLFLVTNLNLFAGEDSSAVNAVAEDNQGNTFTLPVEFAGKVPSVDWLSQVTVVLPANLPTAQELRVRISLHGLTSNKARLRIK